MKLENLKKKVTALHALIPVVGAIVLTWTSNASAQSSPSYEITRFVISGGGTTSTSASYSLTGTFGQPSPVEVSDSASFNLGSGFWGATVKIFTAAIESISYSIAEGVWVAWQSMAGASYTICFTNDLMDVWTALSSFTGTGSLIEWLDDGSETSTPPIAAGVLKRFYRLRGEPPSP
jgi:hypothetical protein